MNQGNTVVLILVVLVIVIWLWYRLKHWLQTPPKIRLPVPFSDKKPKGQAAELLREAGYEVVAGKYRIPLDIWVDEELKQSRLFIDYFCRRGNEWYIVKLARDRQQLSWTGSGLRERFLPYLLLYEEVSGLLYVDIQKQTIRRIVMQPHMEEME